MAHGLSLLGYCRNNRADCVRGLKSHSKVTKTSFGSVSGDDTLIKTQLQVLYSVSLLNPTHL